MITNSQLTNMNKNQGTEIELQMKQAIQNLPFIEDIYDLETSDLYDIVSKIGIAKIVIKQYSEKAPFITDKYLRKTEKL